MLVRATLNLRNAKLLRARESLGLTQVQAARAAGVPIEVYRGLEKLNGLAWTTECGRDHVARVATFFELSEEDVLPEDLRGEVIESTLVSEREVLPAGLLASQGTQTLALPADDLVAFRESREALVEVLDKALHTLQPREEEIVRAYYGIGRDPVSFDRIGRMLRITRERVRAILGQAIRKLQHPARSRIMAKALGELSD